MPLTAGVLQIPTKLLRACVGRVPLMLVGLLAFVALALLILLLSPAQLGRFTALVPIYLLQGLGRSCFEGTNKALYANPDPDPNPNPSPNLNKSHPKRHPKPDPNKALYADFFPSDTAAAFSNIVIFNGGASAAAYFAFPHLAHAPDRRRIKAVAALVPACIAVVGYLGAEYLHRKHPQ